MHCYYCGVQLSASDEVCPRCGKPQSADSKDMDQTNRELITPRTPRYCHFCAAPLYAANEYSIEWDDEKKEFQVYMVLLCSGGHRTTAQVVKHLPLLIAQESTCSCGGRLELSSYAIHGVSNNEIEFEGTYFCPQCRNKKQPLIKNLKRGLANLWRQTTAVEVGVTGVKYKKQTDEK